MGLNNLQDSIFNEMFYRMFYPNHHLTVKALTQIIISIVVK